MLPQLLIVSVVKNFTPFLNETVVRCQPAILMSTLSGLLSGCGCRFFWWNPNGISSPSCCFADPNGTSCGVSFTKKILGGGSCPFSWLFVSDGINPTPGINSNSSPVSACRLSVSGDEDAHGCFFHFQLTPLLATQME